jgi:hypothetical protein
MCSIEERLFASAHQLIKYYPSDAPKWRIVGSVGTSTNQDLSFRCARAENYGSRQRIN